MKISQIQFARQLAAKMHFTQEYGKRVVDAVKELIYNNLAKGNIVEWHGFGQFSVSHREARQGINPRTLERMPIPELNTPKFRKNLATAGVVQYLHNLLLIM